MALSMEPDVCCSAAGAGSSGMMSKSWQTGLTPNHSGEERSTAPLARVPSASALTPAGAQQQPTPLPQQAKGLGCQVKSGALPEAQHCQVDPRASQQLL